MFVFGVLMLTYDPESNNVFTSFLSSVVILAGIYKLTE